MCGICGYIHLDRSKRPSEDILKGMMDAIFHRGPDDSGLYIKDNAALGHRRLSIIDLDTGHQPIFNEDGSLVIVYNGEVYNFPDLKESLLSKGHRFKTRTDTEVVLHAYEEYGDRCLKYFNGMFALAIWDARKGLLLLARDRFGKKPLYYAVFDNQFIFGSELKSILKHPSVRREIDPAALSKYLAYEYVPSPLTIFKKIKKIEPASKLVLQNGSYRIDSYWDLSFGNSNNLSLEETKANLAKLFKESVKRRLISDVPLGVFLSGGIDSSSVVAMMAELVSPKEIKTFSIGFKERSFDESSAARLVANHFGTDHHEETLSPGTMLEALPKVLDIIDEPFADSSIIPTYLVSRFTRRYVKVALGGDGGDELFMGYPSFLAHRLNSCAPFAGAPLKKAILKAFVGMMSVSNDYMSLNFKARRFLRGLDFPDEVRHQVWIGSFTPKEQERLLISDGHLDYDPFKLYDLTADRYKRAGSADPLNRAMYIYIKTYMTDDILTKVDRASMANSLEVRAPFLDKEFCDFAAAIPSTLKLRRLRPKWILKEALKERLPKATLNKGKQGFAVPVAKWLKEDLKDLTLNAFDEKKIKREGLFNYPYIKELLREYLGNKSDTRKEIWALFMFEMWYDRWMR